MAVADSVNRIVGPIRPKQMAGAAALTPKEMFGIMRRRILLIVFSTILGLIIGGVGWYLLREFLPKYTAKTYIRVLPPVEQDPMVIGGPQVNKDVQYGYRASMAALMTSQSFFQRLIERDKVQQTRWFRRFGHVKDVSIKDAVNKLKRHFVVFPQKDGDSIEISMSCRDKEESALIVNEMVDLFIASQGSAKKAEVAEKLARLNEQMDSVQKELTYAENMLDDVRRRYGFVDLEDRYWQPVITRKLNDLEVEQSDLLMTIRQIQTAIGTLDRIATGPVGEQIEQQIEGDPVMVMLAQQLSLQEAVLAGTLTKFGENHREVRRAREILNEIGARRAQRKAEIAEQTRQANLKNAQDQLIITQARLAELERMREEVAAKQRDLDLARVQFEQRAAIRDERKEMLISIKEQIEKLKIIHDDPTTPKVQFVGYAPAPLDMSAPMWYLYFPGGTILGLMIGVGLAFLIEMLNDLVRTPSDVDTYLHIPLLGVVPDAAEDSHAKHVDLCHVVRQAPYSFVSESYRRFRTNLKLSGSVESTKALLVTSGAAEDGKTSLATNLASTFVAENKKVLLVDANLWRPSLHKMFPKVEAANEVFGERAEYGLTDLLMGQCTARDVIRTSGIEGFDIIDSGVLPGNAAELLGSTQMEQLIQQQRQTYDYVIVDGPPILLVSDAKMLARLVDCTVLVFNAGTTRRGTARRAIRELQQVNARIVGCVLFAVRAMKGGYFHEQQKSYQQYQKAQVQHATG